VNSMSRGPNTTPTQRREISQLVEWNFKPAAPQYRRGTHVPQALVQHENSIPVYRSKADAEGATIQYSIV
jgi:hypothetical protein